jgi:hypothetical protein
LTALHHLAQELQNAFDDPQSREGAQKMLASIERMLAILGAVDGRD